MYSEWASLQTSIQTDKSNTSVLHTFPIPVGKDVANSVVRHLAQSLAIGAQQGQPSSLISDADVKWTMEVICFGLTLPFSEHETLKECVNVYCDWMSVLVTPRCSVPNPVCDNPNMYGQVMFQHLYNLFVPRSGSGFDTVKRQALLCHRVLRNLQTVARESTILTRETWETILRLLLAINDTLLAPPKGKDDIGDQLCDRVLSVLFEIWLIACAKSFPSPSLWKTFRDMCLNWRHHEALVIQWHRTNVALTSRLLKDIYGLDFPELVISDEDASIVPHNMTADMISQTWFRFLHILTNPVHLANIQMISQTPKFLHMALTSEDVIDPSQHECLKNLPQIFLRAMKGISVLVDAFLGISQPWTREESTSMLFPGSRHTSPNPTAGQGTPPTQRKGRGFSMSGGQYNVKGAKEKAMGTKHGQPVQGASSAPEVVLPFQITLDSRPSLSPQRPKCNSILHLFGSWLFEAALVGVKKYSSSAPASRRTSFLDSMERDKHHSLPADHTHELQIETTTSNEIGRAEACGALCRIFCAHRTGEEILPVYLARFYTVLYHGLATDENVSGQVLANILFNSSDLLRLDLDGVQVLVPQILKAIELVLFDLNTPFRSHDLIPTVELRKASIHLLLSMLCLPLHFNTLPIKELFPSPEHIENPVTFRSLKLQLIELLLRALTIETDPANTQMLLGGLMLSVQDLAKCEEAEHVTIQETADLLAPLDLHSGEASTEQSKSKSASSTDSVENQGENVTSRTSSHQLKDYDTSYGLFGQAASLVCNRLMASWKLDLNIALSAMEVLSGLAKVQLSTPNALMCKRTVKWICDFIVYQCSRPAPAHSRDLHSMIVAAFNCLALWLVEHHYLMLDKECLHYVLEVVELGLSGSKSQNRASDPPKLKHEKNPMPASARVQNAAEAVLDIIIGQVGAYPPPCGPESNCSLLDEESLLKYCRDGDSPEPGSHFRYYVLENSIIVGLLEQPLGNNQDPLPTVTALIRGPFGRHAWTMQLRHLPRNYKFSAKAMLSDPGRPLPMNNVGTHHNITPRYFPEAVNSVPLCQADLSIPSLESVVTDEKHAAEHQKLSDLISKQIELENSVAAKERQKKKEMEFPNPELECKPPSICQEFQTARMFLSHFGFLSLEALKEPNTPMVAPPLVMLDSSSPTFHSILTSLDDISTRTWDTGFIFYVKRGQKRMQEILNNVNHKTDVQPQFLEFLSSLGWPVNVRKHPGWTGHMSTSWKILPDKEPDEDNSVPAGETGGSAYDGRNQVLYWADICAEVAFVVPSTQLQQIRRTVSFDSAKDFSNSQSSRAPKLGDDNSKQKSLSLELEDHPKDAPVGADIFGSRKFGRSSTCNFGPEFKVLIVWLESYEDHVNFPINELYHLTTNGLDTGMQKLPEQREIYVMFIHALKSGLFRIHMEGPPGRISMAGPLVDGMVVSRRSLGTLVRQTTINIGKRKRLDSDAFQPPHVRRHMKIREIINKYRIKMSEPDFYTALF